MPNRRSTLDNELEILNSNAPFLSVWVAISLVTAFALVGAAVGGTVTYLRRRSPSLEELEMESQDPCGSLDELL
jgi:hypothetical protein